jgi:hypothetical protein
MNFVISCDGPQLSAEEAVHIRIRNQSGYDFEKLWLGSGEKRGATQTTAFGKIASGSTTEYKQMAPIFENYDFADIRVDGEMLLDRHIEPMMHLGVAELSPGEYYTFVYDIVDGEPLLVTIVQDT